MIDSPTKNNRVGMIAGALTLLLFGILILSSPLAQAVGALNIVIYDPTGPQVSTTPVLPTSTAPGVTATSLAQVGTIGAWGNNNAWPVGQIGVSTLTDRTR